MRGVDRPLLKRLRRFRIDHRDIRRLHLNVLPARDRIHQVILAIHADRIRARRGCDGALNGERIAVEHLHGLGSVRNVKFVLLRKI